MKLKLSILCLLVLLLLASCDLPGLSSVQIPPTLNVAFVKTSAAQTVIAAVTQSAVPPAAATPADTATSQPVFTSTAPALPLAATATLTPVPTQVGRPGATQVILCDEYSWDDTTVDVNIPDNTQMTPGQNFVKTWKIKNDGTCTWTAGYKIIFSSGVPMSGQAQPLPVPVVPGQEIEISINFIAPTQLASYSSAWTLQNASGQNFFGSNIQGTTHAKPLYVKIVVK